MTITLFVSIITAASAVSALLTEAIKQAYKNANKTYSANIIALIDSVVVGGLGTAAVYMLMGIPWTVNNIICLIGTVLVVWIICMVGYDKVVQLGKQLSGIGAQIENIQNKDTEES